jgi:hypothetical protein
MHPIRLILQWLLAGAAVAITPQSALSAAANPIVMTDDRVADFAKCLATGGEVVLRPDEGPSCAAFRTGARLLDDITPAQRDPAVVCRRDHTGDRRHLPSSIVRQLADLSQPSDTTEIKKMAESKPSKPIRIAPTGIRLIGAIFCGDEMDLSDLNLSYPLVLDLALFRFGVRGENFRTRGNFSLDGSYVFDNLALNGSRIGGSLFARGGYFENVGLSETEVRGSIYFDHSLLDRTALFDRVSAAGDISLLNTALSRVRVHQSNVKGRLELGQSEARCGYSVRGSDIDEIWATNLGFGSVSRSEDISPGAASPPSTAQRGPPLPPVFRYGWSRSQDKDFYKSLMQNASIKTKTDAAQPCETPPIEIAPELLVLDVRARSVCLQSFHWLTSSDSNLQPRSSIILSEVKIAGSMNVNLFPQNASPAQVLPSQRTMRIEGLNVGVLFFDFSDNHHPYETSVDRLQIERVHNSPGLDCSQHATEADSQLPGAGHVTGWLQKNGTLSLQPLTAFIRAFENAGANPTELKVAKAEIEFDRTLQNRNNATAGAWRTKTVPAFLWEDGFRVVIDYLRIAGGWALGLIADHGFRPIKVLFPVLVILVGFWALFRFVFGVVAFLPDKQTELRPIGFTFVFDRLIPIYRLRDENYQIARFYQRGSGPDEKPSSYFWSKPLCVPASPQRTHYTGICLDILKALGIVLAVFLVAALNALVAR